MFFDDPQNRLSVARTHQRELVQREQMDRLARQVDPGTRPISDLLATALHWLALLIARARIASRGTPASQGSATHPRPDARVSATPGARQGLVVPGACRSPNRDRQAT
jgi:hypothetical protein